MNEVSAQQEIQQVLRDLESHLEKRDIDQVLALFDDTSYWRDFLSFSWNIVTFETKPQIRKMLESRLADVRPKDWRIDGSPAPTRDDGVTEGFFSFETEVGHGYGHIRLKNGRIFTLLTTLQDLTGFEEPGRYDNRPWGLVRGKALTEPTWGEVRDKEFEELGKTRDPYVLIVGGGHNGIILGARLRLYGVPTLIIDTHEKPGDNWRERYNNLQLHNPVWENHLPYIPFPEHWPVYMNKDRFGDWLEAYTMMMNLNYWCSSKVTGAEYDEVNKTWEARVESGGETFTMHPTHLVMATGAEAEVSVPEIKGQDVFKGVQMHSSEYSRPDDYLDKKVVVVGSGTSAHDVSSSFAARNADVTMIQRSPTYVVRPESFNKYVLGSVYSAEAEERGLTTEQSDILNSSIPYDIFFDEQGSAVEKIKEVDADYYERLSQTGYQLGFGPKNSGLFGRSVVGVNNCYIDVGAIDLVLDGRLKVETGSGVAELTEHSVVLEDGRELEADLVVYATGYETMYQATAKVISPEVAEKVGEIGGLGSDLSPRDPGPWEGELRNMWKPVRQEGLWYQPSLIAEARSFSRYVALQLKARMEGLETPVYEG